MDTTETADAKQETEVTHAPAGEGSSATPSTDSAETQGQSASETSPDQSTSEGAGDSQTTVTDSDASEDKQPEQAQTGSETDKQEQKSRTARRIEKVLADKKQAEARAKLAEDELAKVRNLPSAATLAGQQPAQPQQQLPPDQTSAYWAKKYHDAQQSGTATPEQLQEYANQYHSLSRREQQVDLDRRVEQKLAEREQRYRYQGLVESQLDEINKITPFRKVGSNGQPEFIADSPVLNLAYAKAKQAGTPITTQENLIYWLGRAQVDMLLAGSSVQASQAANVRTSVQEIMSRTALQTGGTRQVAGGTAPPELHGEDLYAAAARQLRSTSRK